MVRKAYTALAYAVADDMVFGDAVNPVSAPKWGFEAGAGMVHPDIKVAPPPGSEETLEKLKKSHDHFTSDACNRAIGIGIPSIMVEQEHVFQQTHNPDWGGATTKVQADILQKFHDEWGIACYLRQTVADLRRSEIALRDTPYERDIMATIEACCKNGTSDIAMETMGGKEVLDYSVTRADLEGVLFGIGVCGSIDMEYVWTQVVDICKKNNVIPAGDTNCSGANTVMFIAGGLTDKDVAHTFAAFARAISAPRSLVAMECGCTGPDKDCAYEGPIVKAVSGNPTCQEGKDCVCAHGDVMGNLVAQVCDIWTNESVEYHEEFGGTTAAVWFQAVAEEVALMNIAKQTGNDKLLRDLYMSVDIYRDPQPLILAYPNAFQIGGAIVSDGADIYLRARAAAMKAGEIMKAGHDSGKLPLTKFESDALTSGMAKLGALTDDKDRFIADKVAWADKVKIYQWQKKNYAY